MKLKQIMLLLFILILLFAHCDTTEPPGDTLQPGRRDYNWTVDTVTSPPDLFYLISMWGSSPQNLWTVGPADESINSLWHFNGLSWSKINQHLSSNLQSIWGFDSTNIWICDSPGGNVFHYNGALWSKTGYFPYPEYSLTYFNNIWGSSPNEIYIAGSAYDQIKGSRALLMRYNGIKWDYLELPEKKMSFIWIRKSKENNCLYISAIEITTNGDMYYLFIYDGRKLSEVYSGKDGAYAYEINGQIFICINKKIFKHQNNQLILWQNFSETTYLGVVCGRNEKDLFVVASDGLAHFDGTDLRIIYPTNLYINYIFVMERDIYLICEYRIIIHGKLRDE